MEKEKRISNIVINIYENFILIAYNLQMKKTTVKIKEMSNVK